MRKRYAFLILVWIMTISVILDYVYTVWTWDITVEKEVLPTLFNGLVSSISICIGLTATIIVFVLREVKSHYEKMIFSLILYLLTVPILSVLGSYRALLYYGDYYLMFRELLFGLAFSFIMLYSTLILILSDVLKKVT